MDNSEPPIQQVAPADAQLLLRCAPASVEVSFRVLRWASDLRSPTYGPEASVLEEGRTLSTLETGLENAALERLHAYLSDRIPDHVVVVVQKETPAGPEDLEQVLGSLESLESPKEAPNGRP